MKYQRNVRPNNPVSLANLKPFPVGRSGNPQGRPKGSRNVSTSLINALDDLAPDLIVDKDFVRAFCNGRKSITVADAIAARLIHEALVNGESWAFRELLDRCEGKAPQKLEIEATHARSVEEFDRLMRGLAVELNLPLADALVAYAELAENYGFDLDDGVTREWVEVNRIEVEVEEP